MTTELDNTNDALSVLGLVNALMRQIQRLSQLSVALDDLAKSPEDPMVQNSLESLQKEVLEETKNITELSQFKDVDSSVVAQVETAAHRWIFRRSTTPLITITMYE